MSVDAGSPLAREWAREEIKKLQCLDLVELRREEKNCPFPKGRKAGIMCQKIIVGKMVTGGAKFICLEPWGDCVYHG